MENIWRHDKVIYQIYPKSFQDSTGNGFGDLQGVIKRLDYLKFLGVDILWLTPIYPSPQVDNGYDVADYCAIDPLYGCMEDFEQLVAEARSRGMAIMMDMVFNHTSTEHPWFVAASDPNSPWHSFYIWCDGSPSVPPTNWLSKFGGSTWQWHAKAQKYYLHLFSTQQADLNWEHPPVREAIKTICSFWADKGVAAFRLDVINLISKPPVFCDDLQGDGRRFYTDGPNVHQYLQELNRDVFRPLNLVTVGEMSSTSLQHCQRYAAQDNSELTMVFNFHHLKVDYLDGEKWSLSAPDFIELKRIFRTWQQGMHQRANSALFWGNHDQPRVVSRFGDDNTHRIVSAKMLALVLYGMEGTPYLYQGEEIGMTNAGFSDISQYRDIESLSFYAQQSQQGNSESESLAILATKSRDNSRTPMQWTNAHYAGFSDGEPWLQCNENCTYINVAAALTDSNSILHTYRQLFELRKQYRVIQAGDYHDLLPDSLQIWCYRRCWQNQQLLVIANLTDLPVTWQPPTISAHEDCRLLLSNYTNSSEYAAQFQLNPFQASWWLITPKEIPPTSQGT